MPTARSNFGTAVVGRLLYVIGGTRHGHCRTALATVEAYDAMADRWVPRSDMLTPRSLLGAAVAAGKIHAVGGSEGHERAVEV